MLTSISLKSPSGRLVLTSSSAANDTSVAALRVHPNTLLYLPMFPKTFTVEQAKELREKREASDTWIGLDVHSASNGKFLGCTSLHNIQRQDDACEAGILVNPDVHRGGVGTEILFVVLEYGFTELKMNRIGFITSISNLGMRGWLERVAGETMEGIMREAWKGEDGGYSDAVTYSILAREWNGYLREAILKRILK